MKVVCDSSGCCGIKHIRNFERPAARLYVHRSEGHDEDQSTSEPEPYEPWEDNLNKKVFPNTMTYENYFRALISQITERRPKGMITVNLVSEQEIDDDGEEYFDRSMVKAWRPILTELGFTEVEFINSNSDNIIHHFTLIYSY